MKQTLTAILIGLGLSVLAETPTITNVTARQRYPWNGKVDISYTVTGDVAAAVPEGLTAELQVTATDRLTGNTYTAASLTGDTGLSAGTHSLIWDMNADGLTFVSSDVVFDVAAIILRYLVVDLSGGANARSYPVSYMAEPPNGGFNKNEYKTTKLVLRLLEPGPIPTHDATITKPFYVGLFEVTQQQWKLVVGKSATESYIGLYYATSPEGNVSYNMIRGSALGSQWPVSNAVDSDSFLGKLRTRTGLDFDLPTEAQWEYACRAGTTTTFSYGDSPDGRYMWFDGNEVEGNLVVGTKLPNIWGLYDLHGGVCEWCLDRCDDYSGISVLSGSDPVGPDSGSYRVFRGGNSGFSADECTSSYRNWTDPSFSYVSGFRLVRTVPCSEQ